LVHIFNLLQVFTSNYAFKTQVMHLKPSESIRSYDHHCNTDRKNII